MLRVLSNWLRKRYGGKAHMDPAPPKEPAEQVVASRIEPAGSEEGQPYEQTSGQRAYEDATCGHVPPGSFGTRREEIALLNGRPLGVQATQVFETDQGVVERTATPHYVLGSSEIVADLSNTRSCPACRLQIEQAFLAGYANSTDVEARSRFRAEDMGVCCVTGRYFCWAHLVPAAYDAEGRPIAWIGIDVLAAMPAAKPSLLGRLRRILE
jgi:hypothetical protein